MITIKRPAEVCVVVKKSRFLGYACRADTPDEAQQVIDARRKQHHDARHHCFAWLLEDGSMRYGDDGEPQGTAGLPMLGVVKKSGLQSVLVVTTRYFGGTLLGAGGLCRAYTQSAAQALDAAGKVRLILCSVFACTFDFATFSRVQAPLAAEGCTFDDIVYGSDVRARVSVARGDEEAFLLHVKQLTLGRTAPVPAGVRRVARDI